LVLIFVKKSARNFFKSKEITFQPNPNFLIYVIKVLTFIHPASDRWDNRRDILLHGLEQLCLKYVIVIGPSLWNSFLPTSPIHSALLICPPL